MAFVVKAAPKERQILLEITQWDRTGGDFIHLHVDEAEAVLRALSAAVAKARAALPEKQEIGLRPHLPDCICAECRP